MTSVNISNTDQVLFAASAVAMRSETCPPPEQFLQDEWQALDAQARMRLQDHIVDCAACQVERRLANVFDEAMAGSPRVKELAANAMARAPAVVASAQQTRLGAFASRNLIAAALGTCAVGLAVWMMGGEGGLPPLPEGSNNAQVTRGVGIQLLTPVDAELFRWTNVPAAARYQVTVQGVAGQVIWTQSTADTAIAVPAQSLLGQSKVHWDVRAMDANGGVLAQSAVGVYSVTTGDEP